MSKFEQWDVNQNHFIVFWDCTGLESIVEVDASDVNKDWVQQHLGDMPGIGYAGKMGQTICMLELRARFNPQRFYELYFISTSKDITADTLANFFEKHPQAAANMIRERGKKIVSYRANDTDVKIR